MTMPFTDAPYSCIEGRHTWETQWLEGEGPEGICRACGTRWTIARPPAD